MEVKSLYASFILIVILTGCNVTKEKVIEPDLTNALNVNVDDNQNSVIDINATDYDKTIIYAITKGDSEKFNINSQTGEVTFKKAPTKLIYTFIALATDSAGNQNSQKIVVNINDKTAPHFTSKNRQMINDDQLQVIDINVWDIDPNINYTLGGSDKELLYINENSGEIRLKEKARKLKYDFSAIATDSAGYSSEKDIVLNIKDQTAPIILLEDELLITDKQLKVVDISVVDIDKNISYSIGGGDSSDFSINSTTGELSLKSIATKLFYTFMISTKDSADNQSNKNVKINVEDQTAPVFTSVNKLKVDENQKNILDVNVFDIDKNREYNLSGEDSSSFEINKQTGEISFKKEATKLFYSFFVSVKDSAGNENQESLEVDINDKTAPVFISKNVNHVDENQLNAIDIKVDDIDSIISFSLIGGDSEFFSIDKNSGKVTFKSHPKKLSYIFTVVAKDRANNQSTQSVIIKINDKTAPTFSSSIKEKKLFRII